MESLFNKCFLKAKRLEWAGHVYGGTLRNVLINKLTGKRPRGKPRQWWRDRVNEDIRMVDGTAKLEIAIDRNKWRNLVEAAKCLNGQ